jgi:predicted kinase
MPRGVARRPGKVSGRPRADPAVVAQAIALVREEGLTCEEAGERVTPRLGGNTVRRAMKAQEAAADVVEATTVDLVVMTGLPASGKSTLCRERFASSHVRVSRDEIGGSVAGLAGMVEAQLRSGRSVVLDVTAPTVADRASWIDLAHRCGARAVSVFVESSKADALARNALREGSARVPDMAIHALAQRLEVPTVAEGFDALTVARAVPGGGFEVAEGGASAAIELAPGLPEDVFAPADPERAAALRALVVRGTAPGVDGKGNAIEVPLVYGPDFVAQIAAGEGIEPREVRRLLREAAIQSRLDALPPELARERSIAVAERASKMANDAHDWKNLLLAQQHIDRLRLLPPPADPEGLTRAEVTILLRRVASELQGIEGGVEALRRALAGE